MRFYFFALVLCGCSLGGGYPRAAEVEALRCRGQIRHLAKAIEATAGVYPKGEEPFADHSSVFLGYQPTCDTSLYKCPMTHKQSLVYEVSPDHKSFRLYCSGQNHSEAGLGRDCPSYVSGQGLDAPPVLPTGFPLKVTFKKLLVVEAGTQGGPLSIEAEVDPETVSRELTRLSSQPSEHREERLWANLAVPGAEQLSARLAKGRLYVSYYPSQLH